jgi:hypothetical protein
MKCSETDGVAAVMIGPIRTGGLRFSVMAPLVSFSLLNGFGGNLP